MTYLQFHFIFVIPVIVGLVFFYRKTIRVQCRPLLTGLAFLTFMALAYTTPWDNYLVYKGVWSYPPDRVLFTIGYVPIEEYAFFVLMTWLTGLFTAGLFFQRPLTSMKARQAKPRWMGSLICLGLAGLGAWFLFEDSTLYLGLILAWAMPVLALHWAFGGDWLWTYRRVWFLAIAIPSLYLSFADRIAIQLGIWSIAEKYTTGVHIAGLPFEEALFFTVANILVVQGLITYWSFLSSRSNRDAKKI